MTLTEIKILVIQKNIKMKDLSTKLGVSKEYMYRQIRLNDTRMSEKIKDVLKTNSHSKTTIDFEK